MKIGLMGGTFNPPHKAHIIPAKAALAEFDLDKIVFMPGGNPPHKTTGTAASIRSHMIKLAVEGTDKFTVSDYEIKKNGYSYTSDTLRYLTDAFPDDEFYFIIGGDSFEAFLTWREPFAILALCNILVYPRDNKPTAGEVEEFNKKYNASVRLIHAEEVHISSGEIRRGLENGEDMSEYLDERVLSYIKRNSLYKKRNEVPEEHLKDMLSPSRYTHSLGVASMATSLAGIYGADAKKAYISGLLHDCAKNLTPEESEIKCRDLDVETDEFERTHFPLIHAKIGAELVKTEFGINDEEICSAIRWHTLGRKNMTLLEKIIYVADMTELSRNFDGVEELREIARTNIDEAVKACAAATIKFNEQKGTDIHPNAYMLLEE